MLKPKSPGLWRCFLVPLIICSIPVSAMASQVESFYALPKAKFEKFCEIAKLIPESKRPPVNKNAHFEIRLISEDEKKTPEFKKIADHYETIWKYLKENGKQPSTLKWSGYVLYELMDYLKSCKNIDLMSQAVCEPSGDFLWWVFDKGVRDKYLTQLDPVNYKESELKQSFLDEAMRKHEINKVKLAEKRDELLKEGRITQEEAKKVFEMNDLMYKQTDFPDRGKALMDALKLIHQYLKMVDDDTLVILNIG